MSDMQTAYRLAALAVRQRFAEQHPEDLEVLNRITRTDVAVYSGTFDQVEEVLKCLRIPAMVDPDARKLESRIVFANCSSNYKPALVERIAGHVAEGNWLVSSDWTLDHVLEKAFPSTVRWT